MVNMATESKVMGAILLLMMGAFVLTGCRSASTAKAGVSPEVQKGQEIFASQCASCHGQDATGKLGPSLHALPLTQQQIAATVQHGKGKMPAFALPPQQVDAVAAYVLSLKTPAEKNR